MLSGIRETLSGFKSLIIGLRITAVEAAKPIKTVQYPRETLPMPARFRGHIQLVLDPETGRPRCTACTLCAKACPSGCIELDGIKREGDKKKSVSKYLLDFSKCSLCGSCVEVCPSEAIDFSKQYNVVSLTRSTFDHMDLYAAVEAQAAEWVKTHPQAAGSNLAEVPHAGSAAGDVAKAATPVSAVGGLVEAARPGSPPPATTQGSNGAVISSAALGAANNGSDVRTATPTPTA